MSTTSPPPPPSAEEIHQLVGLGLLVESLTFPNLPMIHAIQGVLSNPDVLSNVSAVLPPTIKDPEATLEALEQVLIHVLPHDDKVWRTIGITLGIAVITLLIVGLRIYGRVMITKKLFDFDWWAIAAVVWTFITTVLYIIGIKIGMCQHVWDLSFNEIKNWTRLITFAEIGFCIALIPVKISFLAFYYRLSPVKLYRQTIMAVGILSVAVTAIGVFILIFQCKPIDYWNHLLTAKCIDQVTAFTVWGVLTVITDILLLLLPIKTILGLQLRKKEKIVIVGMFAAGGLICVASVLRVITLNKAFENVDRTMYICEPAIWSHLELCLAIIISSLPALKYFFARPEDGSNRQVPDYPTGTGSGGLSSQSKSRRPSKPFKTWEGSNTTTVMSTRAMSVSGPPKDGYQDLEMGVYKDTSVEVYTEETGSEKNLTDGVSIRTGR